MVGLSDLPVELLRAVCSQLCTKKNNNSGHCDISRLSRTCRRHRDIIQSLVFTAFAPESHTPVCPRILQLIHALRLRPDLAQHLKYIDLGDIDCEDPLSQNDMHLLNSIATKLNLQPLDPGILSKPKPNPLPFIELLLLHTPNLVRLHLALDDKWRPLFLPAIYHRHTNNHTILPRLITLTLTHHCISHYHWELGLPNFLTILHAAAPNLRHLSTDNPGTTVTGTTLTSTDIYPPLPNLLHLEFDTVCSLRTDVLRGIVMAAPRLEVFALSTGRGWDPGTGARDGDCTVVDIWEAVWLRRGTLSELRLDIIGCDNMEEGEGENMGLGVEIPGLEWSFGSLGEFGRLEVLKVGGYALRVLEGVWRRSSGGNGVDGDGFVENLLPSCVREVTFWEPEGSWVVALRRLAEVVALAKLERFPDLLSVIVAPVPDNEIELPREWEAKDEWLRASGELEKLFQRAGVRFEAQGVRGREPAGPFEMRNPFQF